MPSDRPIALIIPARNEAESLPQVLRDIPTLIDRVIVVDNGSSDGSGEVARSLGAEVIREERPGYGQAATTMLGCRICWHRFWRTVATSAWRIGNRPRRRHLPHNNASAIGWQPA